VGDQKDFFKDVDCNGIFGIDPISGRGWNEVFCCNSESLGVGILGGGDSAVFDFDPSWIGNIVPETFSELLMKIENELDNPQISWVTGYQSTSIYSKMRERNLCNHRDYQNLAKNGDNSISIRNNIKFFTRNVTYDKPMLLFYQPMGDICNNLDAKETLNKMTKPKEFNTNVVETLFQLDEILPKGSHVILTGFVQGHNIYATMSDRMHPFGVKYDKWYDWLACIGACPCTGLLDSNSTLRTLTEQRANLFNAEYQNIVKNFEFKHFDVYYMPFPFHDILKEFTKSGKNESDLFSKVDGFHFSSDMHPFIAQVMWEKIIKDHPFWFPINEHNSAIKKLFGDQGGY